MFIKNENGILSTSYDGKVLFKTQTRTRTNYSVVNSIKESVKINGINSIDPIIVRVHNGQALIVDWHHRYQVLMELGY